MKTKLTTLLLACAAMAASPLTSTAQDARPPEETVRPAAPVAKSSPDGAKRDDGAKNRESDRPKPDAARRDAPPGRPKPDAARRDAPPGHPNPAAPNRGPQKKPEGKKVPFLGIAMREVSPELSAQLGLPEGFGLVVADIMDGSPAKEAGFQKFDVLVLLGDQRIVNMEQFQALIRSQKKGDDVSITLRRKGAGMTVPAKLGEHAFPETAGTHAHPMARGKGPGAKPLSRSLPDSKQRIDEAKKRMEHMREMAKERLQNRGVGEGRPGPFPPRPGMGSMKRDGDRDGPRSPSRGSPPSAHRDGDRDSHPGGPRAGDPPGSGPRPNAEPQPEGNRPGGEQHGDRGPRPGDPKEGGARPDGPPPAVKRPDAPRPDAPVR